MFLLLMFSFKYIRFYESGVKFDIGWKYVFVLKVVIDEVWFNVLKIIFLFNYKLEFVF